MTLRGFLVLAFCAIAFSAFAQVPGNQVELVVPAHDIARGSVIAEEDLTTKLVPVLRASDSLVRDIEDVSGREAKRALRAGELIRTSDLKRPTLVAKGSTVTMIFEVPGIALTSVGRALAEGGVGDTIAVLNPTSYRQVSAVITGPGTVRVGAPGIMKTAAEAPASKAQQGKF
jgi:flagella basal body P-ring formation protein FlgA